MFKSFKVCLLVAMMAVLGANVAPTFAGNPGGNPPGGNPPTEGTPPTPGGPKCGNDCAPQEWPKCPRACLPDRAVPWDSPEEMEPCHCPPQNMCPTNAALNPEDVAVVVTYKVGNKQGVEMIDGTDIPGLGDAIRVTPNNPLDPAKLQDQLFDLVAPIMQQRKGVNIKNLTGNDKVDVVMTITNEANLAAWIDDTLTIPVQLAINCCQGLCPAGMVPKIHTIEIDVPITTGEGNGNEADCTDAEAAVAAAEAALAAAQGDLDNAETAEDAACNAPTGGPGAACDAAGEAVDDAQKEVTAAIRDLEAAETTASVACDIPTTTTEKREVDVFTCHAVIKRSREGCLIEGTKITLSDGNTKPIEELKVGDEVKGNHGAVKVKAMSRFTQQAEYMYSINDGEHFFTEEHPVLTKGGWKSVAPDVTSTKDSDTKIIGKLEVGDKLLTKFGELTINKIEKKKIDTGTPAYNLSVEGDGSFIANGIIMKGFNKMQMHY
ncbi:MAG: Hint domain-containing protein [Rickettsiales bacterium]|nr:Hint domain-containing protein [Rickettsiales bacterium]